MEGYGVKILEWILRLWWTGSDYTEMNENTDRLRTFVSTVWERFEVAGNTVTEKQLASQKELHSKNVVGEKTN